ncbi:NAC-domain-containing protein [Phellopilus nigrolimitatus]|nr:NAC-domain-containing protein [Phellopilus nigrolimitatus]
MDPIKLAKLQKQAASNRIGGKGSVRRKVVRPTKASTAQDDKKLQGALKKLNEVNMFREDWELHAAVPANTFAIYGAGSVKELTELVPGILNQLGPDSLASLRKLAESGPAQGGAPEADDDDDVPDLVENFEVEDQPAKLEKGGELEELN